MRIRLAPCPSRLCHSLTRKSTYTTGELAAAEPAMKAAASAVDVLSKPMLTELKNLKVRVCTCVCVA